MKQARRISKGFDKIFTSQIKGNEKLIFLLIHDKKNYKYLFYFFVIMEAF